MQENLINPQAINQIISSLFGSYEKFVLSLIERRKELEEEKKDLLLRLEKIKKEETLIKKTLTGFHGTKIDGKFYNSRSNSLEEEKPSRMFSLRQKTKSNPSKLKDALAQNVEISRQESLLSGRLSYLNEEKALLDNVLKTFHRKSINGKFYDAEKHSLTKNKPELIHGYGSKASPMDAIGEFLSFKQDEYNKFAGQQIIKDDFLYSKPQQAEQKRLEQKLSLESYQEQILGLFKEDYIPDLSTTKIKEEVMNPEKFNEKTALGLRTGISIDAMVSSIAEEAGLKKINRGKRVKL